MLVIHKVLSTWARECNTCHLGLGFWKVGYILVTKTQVLLLRIFLLSKLIHILSSSLYICHLFWLLTIASCYMPCGLWTLGLCCVVHLSPRCIDLWSGVPTCEVGPWLTSNGFLFVIKVLVLVLLGPFHFATKIKHN